MRIYSSSTFTVSFPIESLILEPELSEDIFPYSTSSSEICDTLLQHPRLEYFNFQIGILSWGRFGMKESRRDPNFQGLMVRLELKSHFWVPKYSMRAHPCPSVGE